MSFKTEFKENVVFSQCLSKLFVGSHEDFKLSLGACFVLNDHLAGLFQISIKESAELLTGAFLLHTCTVMLF